MSQEFQRPTSFLIESQMMSGADLYVVKSELAKISSDQGYLVELGHIGDGTSPAIWKGNMSLASRLASGELTPNDISVAMEMLPRHFIPTSPNAAKRCVEDRGVVGYDGRDSRWYGRPLGPQVQGGTPDKAVAYRLDTITQSRAAGLLAPITATMVGDISTIAARPSMFAPGGHTSVKPGKGKSGCGSVDKQVDKLHTYKDPDSREAIGSKTDALLSLGEVAVEPGFYDDLAESAGELSEAADYFSEPSLAIAAVRRHNPYGVSRVEGKHSAITITVNYVPDTTFHTSEYNANMRAATGKEIYNLNLDAWHILQEHGPREGAILIAQAISTLTHLVDRSVLLFARMPA